MTALRVDRLCRVDRTENHRWGWRCAFCPPPLSDLVSVADSWRAAVDDLVDHLRLSHPRDAGTNGSPADPRRRWVA